MNRLTWNLTQLLRETLCMKPMNCHKVSCDCKPSDTFKCECCDRIQPFCREAIFSLCEDCWSVAKQAYEAAGMPFGEEVHD